MSGKPDSTYKKRLQSEEPDDDGQECKAPKLCRYCGRTFRGERLEYYFLCHTGKQKKLVAEVDGLLRKERGKDTFFDEHSIRLGENLKDAIHRGIHSSTHAILFLSPEFFEKDWPKEELKLILKRQNEITVLPFLVGMNHEELKAKSPELAQIKHMELNEEENGKFCAQEIVNQIE